MKELLPNIYQADTVIKVGPVKIYASMQIVKTDDGVVLIDPFTLPDSETAELEALGKPTHILLCGETHIRDAEAYRDRYGAQVLVNAQAADQFGITTDATFSNGETVPGGLKTLFMPGLGAGETVFLKDQDGGVLLIGDALFNLRASDRGFLMKLLGFPLGLGLMPKLAMKDKNAAAHSYQNLLDLEFDALIMSHGQPILTGAKAMLKTVLNP